ncbi:MAG: hypothetical protein A3C93_04155 [Candidatus Lloydbacteria bacterium RIFCSPHIGHO2_02_FULL_54_17]|uniref:Uncharacterized protein n=1 Tax=Candidatus Lloydbacteria bacterium RIFCSPHIGHO2_02_FULL_54_17 TaxID=1798664 RepID=A0A1G2DI57_9BACT|nr:MAG: hypothetical protein A2762_01175 [Candidatus Lloydbacteria bacterium RIFCSPHIGHO2_01_FULL_54_11]OGZ13364.1 MAG: hypothetical protein A3C93_04155 [Candidatus Lloydbacteria bacterium RIFCSPHIGHO2_02_FULL_54_17]OGZ14167.1 MAG: hypothetical protein A3H76_05465 [Candidatus Lloydbacteria bacterium RIFCSPLOWO2_02_FULL_54_12]
MKKRFFVAAGLSLAVFGNVLAETQTAEPSLPSNLSEWQHVVQDARCSLSSTQNLVQDIYATPVGNGMVRMLLITKRNGERFVQMDVGLISGMPFNGQVYLRGKEGWFSHDMTDPREFEKYTKRFADELGVTVAEYREKCQGMQ